MKIANVTVYVKGQELKPELMTEPEIAAILECVDDLFQTYGSKIVFRAEHDIDEDAIVVRCFEDDRWIPFPKDWTTKTISFANRKEYTLIGSKIPVTPRQLGLSPWNFVEVKLTDWEED